MAERTAGESLHVHPDHLEIVRNILQREIPERCVWAFGSRVTGHLLKRFSDLDLAVEGELTWDQRARLVEAFDESVLPIKVDLVETELLTPEFRMRIEQDFVPVQTRVAPCCR